MRKGDAAFFRLGRRKPAAGMDEDREQVDRKKPRRILRGFRCSSTSREA
jgi:hypothetical protein